jgi:hypothetical protein
MKVEVKTKGCDGQNFELDVDALISKQGVDQSGGILRLWPNWQIFGIKKDPQKFTNFESWPKIALNKFKKN